MATVREIPKFVNGVNIDGLSTTVDAIKSTPEIATFKFRIENRWEDASQNRSSVGGFFGAGQEMTRPMPFVLKADEPPVLLGKDGAANPVEHLLHALASCLTTSMVYHAAARGIELEEVESTLQADIDLRGFLKLDPNVRQGCQGIRVQFRIKANVPEDQLEKIARLGVEHSPVFDSLTNGVPVSVQTERL